MADLRITPQQIGTVLLNPNEPSFRWRPYDVGEQMIRTGLLGLPVQSDSEAVQRYQEEMQKVRGQPVELAAAFDALSNLSPQTPVGFDPTIQPQSGNLYSGTGPLSRNIEDRRNPITWNQVRTWLEPDMMPPDFIWRK
jgi:hypothetical protein